MKVLIEINFKDDIEYVQESAVYLAEETHSGEDVPIYAMGPMSFLFEGTVEQNYIAHAMAYSACIGDYDNLACKRNRGEFYNHNIASEKSKMVTSSMFFTILVHLLFVQ